MIRRSFRVGLTVGLLGGLVFALVKMFGGRTGAATELPAVPTEPWPRLKADPAIAAPATIALVPDPAAPSPVAPVVEEAVIAPATKEPLVAAWVEPTGEVCPTSHPVKAKLSSKIFHLPGMLNYDRTKPDRCYRDATAAEGDGLRAAKR
ncbi:MAG: hypothetical protein ACRDZU_03520 [Acidimicrobiales bacterium]